MQNIPDIFQWWPKYSSFTKVLEFGAVGLLTTELPVTTAILAVGL